MLQKLADSLFISHQSVPRPLLGASSSHKHRGGSGAAVSHFLRQAFFSFLHCFFFSPESLHVSYTASQSFSHTSFWMEISSVDEHGSDNGDGGGEAATGRGGGGEGEGGEGLGGGEGDGGEGLGKGR